MKTNKLKILILVLFLFLFKTNGDAQGRNGENEAALNNIYKEFALAYEQKNIAILEQLYSNNCLYLTPREKTGILNHTEAMEGFSKLFDKGKSDKSSYKLEFKLVGREISDLLAYDVGYYKLTITAVDKTKDVHYGKFTTVLSKEYNAWKIKVDAYNSASKEVYNKTETIQALSDQPEDE